ncbi:cyclopropane-fatty-acyl-phospholipid synthase family protein [Microbulbifer sp. GL-2]|uniref:SAM-dependent methyltransferase n=1 Tax=Microbulbifer sp. GL-2 TaxID=2591606 RepID=UPI0011655414|nr:cyclopropane-fatty-acyl-phospholipid synthase family protein [Microbulbifer sp. GL-2]BBM03056.1 cyclopropane-fatty-acyl-phospholipid synthase [Microbulbifer sp. GL-2]
MKVVQKTQQTATEKYHSWPARLARKLVLSKMRVIAIGHLVIEDEAESFQFGQPPEQAKVCAHIKVLDGSAYVQVLLNGTIGSGEAYMQGSWTSPNLLNVIRLMVDNMDLIEDMDGRWSRLPRMALRSLHQLNSNNRKGSRRNIAAHYDLGNEFFQLFLDKTMLYSSAVFSSAQTPLYDASVHKMEHICRKLQLQPSDHLLEIGAGWGAMAIFAAKHYGCRVTTATISEKQYEYVRRWIEREGLQDKVSVLLQDYRDLRGSYDKLVSIEMVEAVGHEYHRKFFSTCSHLLKEDGLMVMQAITIQDQRYQQYRKEVDFIQRYIFPGGCLPSNQIVAHHVATATDMQIVDLEDITAHYARTIDHWRHAFLIHASKVKALGFDEQFIRMWEFYLCYCEGGFMQRVISAAQFVFAKPRFLGSF